MDRLSNLFPIWDAIKVIGVFTFCVQAPGLFVTGLIYGSGSIGNAVRVSLATGLGLAIVITMGAGVGAFGGSLGALALAVVIVNLLLLALSLYMLRRTPGTLAFRWPRRIASPVILLVVLSLFLFGLALRAGAVVAYAEDAWFHIAHASKALDLQVASPLNAYWQDYRPAEAAGVWHVVLGLISYVAGVEILTTWHVVNGLLVVFAIAAMYAIASTLLASNWLGLVVAAIFMLGRGGDGMAYWLGSLVYPAQLCYTLMWQAFFYFFLYIQHQRLRDLAVGLIIGNLPLLIHPQEYIYLCCGISLFMFLAALVSHERRMLLKRSATFLALLLVIGGPLTWLRFPESIGQAGSTALPWSSALPEGNLLRQILTWLSPPSDIDRWIAAFMPLGLLVLLISWRLVKRLKADPLAVLLFALTWGPVALFFIPGLNAIAQIFLPASAWRLALIVPMPLLVGYVLRGGINFRHSIGIDWRRNWHFLDIFGVTIAIIVFAALNLRVILPVDRQLVGFPLDSAQAFRVLDQLSPDPKVVLSDPATSFIIPGLTRHYVVLNEPWHGARPDLDERFRKARQLLSDPHQTSQSAVETLEDYDIEYIVINTASWIDDPSRVIMPFYSQQTLLFLERNSRCFEREYADATLHIYRYTHQCAGVALQGKDQPAQLESKATAPVKVLGVQMTRDLTLVTVSLPPGGTVAPGQALDITLVWQAVEPVMQPYAISTEILCPYPELDRPYGKLFRKAREIRSGQALKANEFHWLTIPLGDVQSGQFIYEQVALDLPMNMGEGRCSVAVFLLGRGSDELRWRPLLPDIFMENRYLYNGAEIAELTVARSLD